MALLKLSPSFKDYLWGGHKLVEDYHKQYDGEVLAESWELSCHPDGPSTIMNGAYAGKTLKEYIEAEGREVLGTNCRRFQDFPILIKFIDAKDNLSIQVHPDNSFALKNEGQYGKTEMWYVMDCREGAYLYYGFKKQITKEEFAARIENDTLLEVLHAVPVQKGDVLFIEAGTIHAIGKDIVIAEIQQNSNVTYRVYDYGRVGKDGKKRDLHIEKALAVTNRVPILRSKNSNPHVASCDYFTVDKLMLDGTVMKKMTGTIDKDSFASILFMEGKGTIWSGDEVLRFQKGDSFFLSAGSGVYEIAGTCEALVTTIREKVSEQKADMPATA
ncbi:MAG: class I mannose-6-phosphate isomerase [Eubacteriales bacterium]|nr:class I mannose-6-phosphate isomerase [Eubacteriales bacterium]